MKKVWLHFLAWAIAGVFGALTGIFSAAALAVLWALITGHTPNYPAYTAGFIAASITWPFCTWLEQKFGLLPA